MNITIGITTYNRFSYLLKMKQSLLSSNGLERCTIRVYDDCSTDFGVEDINHLFPNAKEVIVRPVNLGPCANMHQMYLDFLNTKDSLLLAADSDLLFNPDWIDFVLTYFPKTDGILSLYNSVLHRPRKEICIGQVTFLQKRHLGSAGVIMHRDIVRDIVNNVPPTRGYDWSWSNYLRKTGKRLLVSKMSYVQHIGLYGYNCDGFKTIDFGLNFYPGNKHNEQFLIDYFQNSLLNVKTVEETIKIKNIKRTKKNRRKLRRIEKHSKEQLALLLNGSCLDKWC